MIPATQPQARPHAPPGLGQRPRLVLLGASNVRMALPLILDEGLRRISRPADVFVACGHGRSYGMETFIPGRGLPGIAQCGLWDRLPTLAEVSIVGNRVAQPPLRAVLADIGNDLFYEMPPADIAGHVETCLQRLSALGRRIVIMGLPLCNVSERAEWNYRFLRTFFFPSLKLSTEELRCRIMELDERLRGLAQRYEAGYIIPIRGWYGMDPIHFSRRRWREIWRAVLAHDPHDPGQHDIGQAQSPYPLPTAPHGEGLRLGEWLSVKRRRPQTRMRFGRRQDTPQPALVLGDGTSVSYF